MAPETISQRPPQTRHSVTFPRYVGWSMQQLRSFRTGVHVCNMECKSGHDRSKVLLPSVPISSNHLMPAIPDSQGFGVRCPGEKGQWHVPCRCSVRCMAGLLPKVVQLASPTPYEAMGIGTITSAPGCYAWQNARRGIVSQSLAPASTWDLGVHDEHQG
jgi:hypothetical protein